jgi:hypothetical protein
MSFELPFHEGELAIQEHALLNSSVVSYSPCNPAS